MPLTTKKIQLYPIGDKEEVNRVFEYLRNGMYQQHHILNTYMSQVGCLYYKYSKDYNTTRYSVIQIQPFMIFRRQKDWAWQEIVA